MQGYVTKSLGVTQKQVLAKIIIPARGQYIVSDDHINRQYSIK